MTKLAALLIAAISLSWGIAFAEESENLEYKVKAAYLYNFTKFIVWPDKNTSPYFNICIVGDDPFGALLNSLESKTALDKPIHVLHINNSASLKGCHIAYFERLTSPIESSTRGLLVVGSLPPENPQAFFARGGMIGFALEDDKIKLRLSAKSLKTNDLTVSAKLVEVSTLVDGGSP